MFFLCNFQFFQILVFFFCVVFYFSFNPVINVNCDAPLPWAIGFQDPATPVMEGIISLHYEVIFYLIVIAVLIFWIMGRCLYLFNSATNNKASVTDFSHAVLLEIIWTIVPACVIISIAIPSFSFIYSMEETLDPEVTLKVIGHQWYWGYEYADFLKFENGDILEFDSYLIPESDMKVSVGSVVGFRLLDVDTRIVLPIRTFIRLLVTSEDVLHSWAVPSFGIKLDACPGRLNQVIFYIKREGVFFGQCSEICGVLHGFMPIAVRTVTWGDFTNWVVSKFPLIDLTKRTY